MKKWLKGPRGFIAYGLACWVLAGLIANQGDGASGASLFGFIGFLCVGWGVGSLRLENKD